MWFSLKPLLYFPMTSMFTGSLCSMSHLIHDNGVPFLSGHSLRFCCKIYSIILVTDYFEFVIFDVFKQVIYVQSMSC